MKNPPFQPCAAPAFALAAVLWTFAAPGSAAAAGSAAAECAGDPGASWCATAQPPMRGGLQTENQRALRDFVQALREGSDRGSVEDLHALGWLEEDLAAQTAGILVPRAESYQRYVTDAYFSSFFSGYLSARGAADAMHSCPQYEVNAGVIFGREGSCLWYRVSGHWLQRDAEERADFEEGAIGYAAGGQRELAPGLHGGLGLFYQDLDISYDGGHAGEGKRILLHAIAKWQRGGWTLSAVLGGGLTKLEHDRKRPGLGQAAMIDADQNLTTASAGLRAAYQLPLSRGLYLRPSLGVSFDRQWQDEIEEEGASGARVEGFSHDIVTLNPSIELGADFTAGGRPARMFSRIGALWIAEGEILAHEMTLPGAAVPLTIRDSIGPLYGDASAGVDLAISDRSTLKFAGTLRADADVTMYGGSARFSLLF